MRDPITGKQWIDPKTLEENDYCSLHGHSTFSVGDAIGKPEDIVSSAIENGMDAIAITDHGNCNVVGDFYLHKKKLEDQGVKFKASSAMNSIIILPLLFGKGIWSTSKMRRRSRKEREWQIRKILPPYQPNRRMK